MAEMNGETALPLPTRRYSEGAKSQSLSLKAGSAECALPENAMGLAQESLAQKSGEVLCHVCGGVVRNWQRLQLHLMIVHGVSASASASASVHGSAFTASHRSVSLGNASQVAHVGNASLSGVQALPKVYACSHCEYKTVFPFEIQFSASKMHTFASQSL